MDPFFRYSWRKNTWENFVEEKSTNFIKLMKKLAKNMFNSC